MKKHLIVFCDSVREAREGVEQIHGIPQKYCAFIARGDEEKIRGFIDLPFLRGRRLTDYEESYTVQHNMSEATEEVMIALQLELTSDLTPEPSPLRRFTDDALITELESRGRVNKEHSAVLRIADFSMKHTLRCHPDLFNCDIHKKLEQSYLDSAGLCPVMPGHYSLGWNADHKLDLTFVKELEPTEQ